MALGCEEDFWGGMCGIGLLYEENQRKHLNCYTLINIF